MVFDLLLAGVAVADFPRATAWYWQLLGRAADVVVHEAEIMWHIRDAACLYVVEDPGRAGKALVTVAVPDVDEAVAEIGVRGISGAGIETVASAGGQTSFADPEGNTISFIEVGGP